MGKRCDVPAVSYVHWPQHEPGRVRVRVWVGKLRPSTMSMGTQGHNSLSPGQRWIWVAQAPCNGHDAEQRHKVGVMAVQGLGPARSRDVPKEPAKPKFNQGDGGCKLMWIQWEGDLGGSFGGTCERGGGDTAQRMELRDLRSPSSACPQGPTAGMLSPPPSSW